MYTDAFNWNSCVTRSQGMNTSCVEKCMSPRVYIKTEACAQTTQPGSNQIKKVHSCLEADFFWGKKNKNDRQVLAILLQPNEISIGFSLGVKNGASLH